MNYLDYDDRRHEPGWNLDVMANSICRVGDSYPPTSHQFRVAQCVLYLVETGRGSTEMLAWLLNQDGQGIEGFLSKAALRAEDLSFASLKRALHDTYSEMAE